MSLTEMKKIPLISLPYLKKRLRRITALGFRNLTVNQLNFNVYFTLHRNEKTVAFYTSELVENKRSPEWSYLHFPVNAQLLHEFVIRVWVTSSNNCRLFLEYDVHLDDSLILDEQTDDSHRSNNSLWLEMFGHRFTDNEPILDNKKYIRTTIPAKKSKRIPLAKSYDSSSIQRMINTIDSTRMDNRSSKECLDRLQTFFNINEDYFSKTKEREVRKVRIDHLKQYLLLQVSNYERRLTSNQYRQKIINEKKNRLEQNLLQLLNQQKELNLLINQLNQSKCLLHDLIHLINFRQKDMISELYRYVYPIIAENKKEFSIGNIRLPPAEDKSYLVSLTREREYEIEAALGYCAHIVLIISQFLQLPLRFPIDYYGVSSIKIYDYSQQKPDFPLCPSYDARSFEYGLFLLNRDIGQIMSHCRVGNRYPDYRKTLENLKEIMEQYFLNVNKKPQAELFILNQQTILLNTINDRTFIRNKRNSSANSVFSPSRSAISSAIEMNDDDHNEDDTHDVDLFPTLNTITPRLTMQFSQPH